MSDFIELRVYIIGQNEPIVLNAKDKKDAAIITKGFLREMQKPTYEYVTIQAVDGQIFVNPRFVTMITSSVSLMEEITDLYD